MSTSLREHNQRVRDWAAGMPPKYRKSALAFGYRADAGTLELTFSLESIARLGRKRPGEGVSRKTLVRHLPAFVESGAITVRRNYGGRNGRAKAASTYTIHLDRQIGAEVGKRQRRRERDFQRDCEAILAELDTPQGDPWSSPLPMGQSDPLPMGQSDPLPMGQSDPLPMGQKHEGDPSVDPKVTLRSDLHFDPTNYSPTGSTNVTNERNERPAQRGPVVALGTTTPPPEAESSAPRPDPRRASDLGRAIASSSAENLTSGEDSAGASSSAENPRADAKPNRNADDLETSAANGDLDEWHARRPRVPHVAPHVAPKSTWRKTLGV